MKPCLPNEHAEIYSTPTPKMFITMVGVQYLYPRPDYESWSNKTSYKLGKEDKSFLNYNNLDLNLSLL
jgi:hypothetical protein